MPHMLVRLSFILTGQHCRRYSDFAHCMRKQKVVSLILKENVLKYFATT